MSAGGSHFYHIPTGDYYRVVKLTNDRSFCPWSALQRRSEYTSDTLDQFLMSVSKPQTRPRESFVVTE